MNTATTHTTTNDILTLSTTTAPSIIVASEVADEQRADFWPLHFGAIPQWISLEPRIFSWLDRMCADYCGGLWHFYTLSNGGAFIAPDSDETWPLFNAFNGNDAELSNEATGITICLLEFSHHACRTERDEMTEHYYRLRDYALDHPECAAIMRIID